MRQTGVAIEPNVDTLRVANGARAGAGPRTAALSAPADAARGREGEWLLILLDLTGPASSHLYREMREVAAQAYWTTAGSVTAALRKAAVDANRYLFKYNLRAAPSDRCYGALCCAVLHDNDLFTLHAGPVRACILHQAQVDCFPGEEEIPQLGMGTVSVPHLHHAFLSTGDKLLLASASLTEQTGEVGVRRALAREDAPGVLAGLEQIASGSDFTALVARMTPPAGRTEVKRARVSAARARRLKIPIRRQRPQPVEPVRPDTPPETAPAPRAKPARKPGPTVAQRLSRVGARLKAAAVSVGRGAAAAAKWVAGGVQTLVRRMLPGPEREAYRRSRTRRPPPPENRTVMASIAVAIPVVLLIVAALTYQSFGREARFQSLMDQAEREITLAESLSSTSEEARPHWEEALRLAEAAVEMRPEHDEATALKSRVQEVLDRLDGITRLSPIHLAEFGQRTGPDAPMRRLAIHGREIFVLDPGMEWVAELTLNQEGEGIEGDALPSPILRTDQLIGNEKVGDLIDFVWVSAEGGRQTSGLVVLEEDGALVTYDPTWEGQGGILKLTRSLLGRPPSGAAKAVASYRGRLYILDPVDNQLWRYEPQGDLYPNPPDRYFVTSPQKPLQTALDVAVDGNVYLLYDDGTILKFRDREEQPFEVRGLPDEIGQAVALAVDPESTSGFVYVVDRGDESGSAESRILVLGPDGLFKGQLRAPGAFDALEGLAVDESGERLYAFSGEHLYTAQLPRLW